MSEDAFSDLEMIPNLEDMIAYLVAHKEDLPHISLGVHTISGKLVGFGLIRLNTQKTVAVLQGSVHKQHQNRGMGVEILTWQQAVAESQFVENSGRLIFDPIHSRLAFSTVGNHFVGYYLSEKVIEKPNQAWLEILAIHPRWQGKG